MLCCRWDYYSKPSENHCISLNLCLFVSSSGQAVYLSPPLVPSPSCLSLSCVHGALLPSLRCGDGVLGFASVCVVCPLWNPLLSCSSSDSPIAFFFSLSYFSRWKGRWYYGRTMIQCDFMIQYFVKGVLKYNSTDNLTSGKCTELCTLMHNNVLLVWLAILVLFMLHRQLVRRTNMATR